MNIGIKICTLAGTITTLSSLSNGAADFQNDLLSERSIMAAPSEDNWQSKLGLGGSFSSLGFGAHITYDVHPKFYLKAELNGISMDRNIEIDQVNYDGKLDFFSSGLTANYLPFADQSFGKGFRLSFGGYAVDNKVTIDASSVGSVIIIGNATSYTLQAGDTLTGEIGYSSFAPYLGLGWDWAWGEDRKYTLSLDAGIMFSGKPDIKLSPNSALLGAIPQFEFDNEINQITNEVKNLEYYPLVKLAFTYRF